jgi:hypothetical protein
MYCHPNPTLPRLSHSTLHVYGAFSPQTFIEMNSVESLTILGLVLIDTTELLRFIKKMFSCILSTFDLHNLFETIAYIPNKLMEKILEARS